MSLVEQKLNILPEHFSSSLDCVCIVLFKLIFCVVFCGSLFVLLYLVIVVSVFLYLVIVVSVTFGLRLLFTHLVSCGHCSICYLWITASVYPFGILWSLYPLDYGFCLPIWYLVVIVVSVTFGLRLLFTHLVSCGYLVVIVVSVTFGLRLLFTHLVSCGHCSVCYLWITASVYPIWYLVSL